MIVRTKIISSSGIYRIKSKVNGKIYIGSAINLLNRCYGHYRTMSKERHGNPRLQNHCNKYGIDDLQFGIIEFCVKENLIRREQFYINTLNPEFNICRIAGSPLGHFHSEETKRKISLKGKGRFVSKETRRKISFIHKGKIISEEIRQRMSEGQKSENCRNYSLSKKTRWKMMQSRKGENNSFYGKEHTEETKELNRKAHLGKPSYVRTPKQRKALSERQKGEKGYWFGKHHTKKWKRKVSIALKKTLALKKELINLKNNRLR